MNIGKLFTRLRTLGASITTWPRRTMLRIGHRTWLLSRQDLRNSERCFGRPVVPNPAEKAGIR